MTTDYLVQHALKNVWCTPNQDTQVILQPARLTPLNGVWNTVKILRQQHTLPQHTVRFHVYQIGQLHPSLLGLFPSDQKWTTLAFACNASNLITNVYSSKGIQLPRTECWYMITKEKNLILAIKEQPRINFNLQVETLYFRVYSNAYFNSERADVGADFIEVDGKRIVTTADILALQNRADQLSVMRGATMYFVNGIQACKLDLFSSSVGDFVEYVYDSSILRIVDFPITTTPTFVSTLDNKHKYLLHYPGDNEGSIDYLDDIDVYLLKPTTNGRHIGVYYHKNQIDALRMVTHKDYTIVVPYVEGLATDNGWDNTGVLKARLYIRKSGYLRNLVNETNRILEMYKLSDAKLLDAMNGVNSSMPNWTADNLESSFYTAIMSEVKDTQVTLQLVQDAYGYNAMSKILSDTPKIVYPLNGVNVVDVPHGLYRNSTAYEYDASGKLINWYSHNLGSKYIVANATTALVEMIAGVPTIALDEHYGPTSVTLDPTAEYRMYKCRIIAGLPSNVWVDVTGTGDYAVINGALTWTVNQTVWYPMVRSNKTILAYDLSLDISGGVCKFHFDVDQTRFNVKSTWVMQIPMGELDVWLNGYSLIEDIDYFLNGVEVVIVNKQYMINPLTQNQKITVRFTGFCDSALKSSKPKDRGFIEYGMLSHNNRFDIKDDKILRIVAGGKTFDRSSLLFAEDSVGVIVPDASNGQPYMLRDIVAPLKGMAVSDTYALRALSLVIDQRVTDYMTIYAPEKVQTGLNVIPKLYELFSPFLCKIIYDLKANDLNNQATIRGNYSDDDVTALCQPYVYLLLSDPAQSTLKLNENYVIVRPHNLNTSIALDIYQYKFLNRVIKLYYNGVMDVSQFVSLSTA